MRLCVCGFLLILLIPMSAPSATLIIRGLESHRIYQRDSDDTATIPFTISGVPSVVSDARISLSDVHGTTLRERHIHEFDEFTASGECEDVPVGGPYAVKVVLLRGDEVFLERVYTNLFVGDLWILAGQSNMEGTAHLQDLEPPSPFVQVYRLNDEWTIAEDPLSNPGLAIDPVHWRTQPQQLGVADALQALAAAHGLELTDFVVRKEPLSALARTALESAGISMSDFLAAMRPLRGDVLESERRQTRGAGLGVAFGKRLHSESGVPIGLIMNANGGTSMRQWDPELAAYGGESLYGSLMRRVEKLGGRVRGVAWYQGENEAVSGEDIGEYYANMNAFVNAMRRDLNDAELPFIMVQLGRNFNTRVTNQNWFQIQTDQLALEAALSNVWLVPAFDESMSDPIHLDALGLRRLGRRMATVALGRLYGEEFLAGPRPSTAAFVDDQTIRISFNGVNGGLVLRSPFPGFEVYNAQGRQVEIESVSIDPEHDGALLIRLPYPSPDAARIRHGYGINPISGISDEVDLSVPVFGWMDLSRDNSMNKGTSP